MGRHVALDEDGGPRRVDAEREVLRRGHQGALAQQRWDPAGW